MFGGIDDIADIRRYSLSRTGSSVAAGIRQMGAEMSSFDLISRTRWGSKIYQGSEKAVFEAKKLTGPYMVVSLVGVMSEIFDGKLVPVLAVWIDDKPGEDNMEVIPDDQLQGMLDACIACIRRGISVVIHCVAGRHRSTYFDVALHMRLYNMSYDEALAWVKDHHPEAEGRLSGKKQLERMEADIHKS